MLSMGMRAGVQAVPSHSVQLHSCCRVCLLARRHYRKVLLAAMPTLNYLDEMPAFPKDRRLAKAFISGGMEAERK